MRRTDTVNQLVLRLKQERAGEPAPEGTVEALAIWCTDAGPNAGPRWALHNLLERTGASDMEAALRAIAEAPIGDSKLEGAVQELAEMLLRRRRAPRDLATQLIESGDESRILAGVCLAAGSESPDVDRIARVLETSSAERVHAAAMQALAEVAQRDGAEPRSREVAGRAAVRAFETRAPRSVREAALPALVLGGPSGLATAERIAVEGGLAPERRAQLFVGLVEHGRLAQLLERAREDPDLLVLVAHGVFDATPPREADVLLLWPLVPEIIRATDETTELYPEEAAADIGRLDLVEGMVTDEELPVRARASAFNALYTHDGVNMARAIGLAERLLLDRVTPVDLRREMLDVLWSNWDVDDAKHLKRLLGLVERVAREESNEWVRSDARGVASFLRERVEQR